MSVSITPGKAYINGRYIQIDSNEVLTLDQAVFTNRIDAIVLRFDNSQAVRNIVPTVKKGEPATSPYRCSKKHLRQKKFVLQR